MLKKSLLFSFLVILSANAMERERKSNDNKENERSAERPRPRIASQVGRGLQIAAPVPRFNDQEANEIYQDPRPTCLELCFQCCCLCIIMCYAGKVRSAREQ